MTNSNDSLWRPLHVLAERLLATAPTVAAVIAVAIVGGVASLGARWLVREFTRRSGLEQLAERVGAAKLLYAVGLRRPTPVILGNLAAAAVALLTLAGIAEMLALPGIAQATAALTAFLPRAMVAAVISIAGLLAADVARNVVIALGKRDQRLTSATAIARALYVLIVAISLMTAAEQVGVETRLLQQLATVVIGAVVLSGGLAFALAVRPVLTHIVARHYVGQLCRVGQTVRIGAHTGEVVAFTMTSIILRTREGRLALAAGAALEAGVVALRVHARPSQEEVSDDAAPDVTAVVD